MVEQIPSILTFLKSPLVIHISIITFIYWITWAYCVRGKFLIDDIEGIDRFTDRYDKANDKVLNTYIHEENGKKTEFRNRQFNQLIKFPASIIRWLRLVLGGKHTVIGKNKKGHEVFGTIQDPFKHHVISLCLHYINAILTYFFVSKLFGSNIGLMTTLLFIVHPATTQCVAWISGIGYLLCLFGALSTFLISFYIDNEIIRYSLIVLFCIVSSYGLFSGALNWIILAFFGDYIGAGLGFGVFWFSFATFGKGFVNHRVNEFKRQNMGGSTFFKWRKIIIMAKTVWYYVRLVVFPRRLGLFHKWGYHYDERLERMDLSAFAGFCFMSLVLASLFLAPYQVAFGLLWFCVYIAVFSNFITAMQFVVDRYAFISTLGYCLILSYFLQAYPIVFAFILGLYMMRTMMHLPTYNNLESFYRSNVWNFPNSEVAWGNLGVTYMNQGNAGSAVDAWQESIKINRFYDVPHYNLYSIFRSSGQVQMAYDHLKECLNSKVVHFQDLWSNEKNDMENQMKSMKPLNQYMEEVNERYRSIQPGK